MQERPLLGFAAAFVIGCSAGATVVETPADPQVGARADSTAGAVTAGGDPDAGGADSKTLWVTESPSFDVFLTAAMPACGRRETFMREQDGSFVHGYDVDAPGLSQATLEARFIASARKLGLPLSRLLTGTLAKDEARGVKANLDDGRVTVFVMRAATSQQIVEEHWRNAGAETAGLLAAVSVAATFRFATLEHEPGGGVAFQAEMDLTRAGRAAAVKWAEAAHLAQDGDSWVRRHRPQEPNVPSISIDLGTADKLTLFERRGAVLEGPGCRPHPSRQSPIQDAGGPTDDASIDDLMRQMMGE